MKTTQFLKMPATFVALGVIAFAMSTVSGAAPTATKGNRSYQSLSDAITAMRYAVAESELGATAANTANNVRMSFTSDELQLKSIAQEKGWNLKWGLHSVGYGANQTIVPAGELRTNGNRVELVRSGQNLTEWFVNNPSGLEHGFTVAAPPGTKTGRGALRLVMKVKGDLTARVDQDGQALTLTSERGEHVLRYEKLKVWDANGQTLVARMRTSGSGGEVWLEVEDEAAVYPLTIDPTFTLQQKLTASDAFAFGNSVAISGDTAVIGAPTAGVDGSAAYIFVRSGTTWTQQQRLTAPAGSGLDGFGNRVAIEGDTVTIGAAGDTGNRGAAYIFVRSGTTWTQQQKLTSSDGVGNDRFGASVAISGDSVIVGAAFDVVGSNTNQGSAYIFTRSGTTWTEQQKLISSDGATNHQFGGSVAIEGDTVIIGAIGVTVSSRAFQGAAYIFTRSGTTWSEQQRLTSSSNSSGNDLFGTSVSISSDTVIAGATEVNRTGSAYVFVRTGTTWTEQQRLTASDGASSDRFGGSVAIEGDTVIIGADQNGTGDEGSAYIFARSGTTWTQQQKLSAFDTAQQDFFGTSVALSGNTVIVGARGDDIGSNVDQGSAYVFLTPTPGDAGLLNISTRLQVLTGDQVLIGGFIVTGTDPKMVILRAIGPALIDFGISDALADPVLELHAADGSLIMSNDNWKMDQQSEIEMTGLAPTKDLESAILATLDPGAYTAIVSGKDGGTGVGLVEVYDLDATAASELANISTRGFVETGNNVMIGGFILGGDTGTSSVLIRAIGPTLTDFGVAGALEDPTLELHDAQGAVISSNDNWMDDQKDEIEATGLAPQDELESAILETLAPGAYTAIVAGQSDGTGIGLVEVYRLP